MTVPILHEHLSADSSVLAVRAEAIVPGFSGSPQTSLDEPLGVVGMGARFGGGSTNRLEYQQGSHVLVDVALCLRLLGMSHPLCAAAASA